MNSRRSHQNGVDQVLDLGEGRILCVADVRGEIRRLNSLAKETGAKAIIHTGDFGFYEKSSLDRISDRTLKHLVQFSTLIQDSDRAELLKEPLKDVDVLRKKLNDRDGFLLSDFPLLLSGEITLAVPVFTVWGACEDVTVLEKFRSGEYKVHNLYVLDESTTRTVDIGGIRLRLLGLGGAVVHHKLFDNGEGSGTIAGGFGTMWTTMLQIGELVDTFKRHFDPSETRILVTHASPGREGLLAQLALQVRADLTISGGLHFRYGVSYNEFSVQHDSDNYRNKLVAARNSFNDIWETVRTQVETYVDDRQRVLLSNALAVTNRLPPESSATGEKSAVDDQAFRNTWNFNLPDAAFGWLALDIKNGRVSSEMKSHGFNFAHRRQLISSQQKPNTQASAATNQSNTGNVESSWRADASATGHAASEEEEQVPPGSSGGKSTSSAGGGTTSSRGDRSKRNPNTLYLSQLPSQHDEADIRKIFSEEVSKGITKISVLDDRNNPGAKRQFCYVEFSDAKTMQEALNVEKPMVRDHPISIKVAEDRSQRYSSMNGGRGSMRGGRTSRGFGRGGGFGGRGSGGHRGAKAE